MYFVRFHPGVYQETDYATTAEDGRECVGGDAPAEDGTQRWTEDAAHGDASPRGDESDAADTSSGGQTGD